MKANELRIGNFVSYSRLNEIIIIEQISGLDKLLSIERSDEFIISKSHFPPLTNYAVEPIPLTEEWLLKFGFEKYKKETDYDSIYEIKNINIPKSGYFEFAVGFIENEINIFLYSGECLKHIKHVHQLQNLYFALTGDELTLKKS